MSAKEMRPGFLARLRDAWQRFGLPSGMPYAELPFHTRAPKR